MSLQVHMLRAYCGKTLFIIMDIVAAGHTAVLGKKVEHLVILLSHIKISGN